MALNILKNADLPEDDSKKRQIPQEMLAMLGDDVSDDEIETLTHMVQVDPNNIESSINNIMGSIKSALETIMPPGTDLEQMLNSIDDLSDEKMSELMKSMGAKFTTEDDGDLDLKDPYFFKHFKAESGLEEMFKFKKDQKYSISELKVDKFNIYDNDELTDFQGFLSTLGAIMFMPRIINNHIAICQFGAPKVPSIFVTIYKENDELKAYINSSASAVDVEGNNISRTSNENTPEENYYEALNETKNIFRFEKNVVFPLYKVGRVELTSDVDSKYVQLGKIHFHDTVEARLIKSDLFMSEDAEETEIYVAIVDPFSKEPRKLTDSERNKWKDYISFMNLFNIDGAPIDEGKLKFNDTELSKELPIKIINNRLFIELDFGRLNI